MTERDERERPSEVEATDVISCVRRLNGTIGELAAYYGTAAVVAALTEIMGCASCATDSVERGASARRLVDRVSR